MALLSPFETKQPSRTSKKKNKGRNRQEEEDWLYVKICLLYQLCYITSSKSKQYILYWNPKRTWNLHIIQSTPIGEWKLAILSHKIKHLILSIRKISINPHFTNNSMEVIIITQNRANPQNYKISWQIAHISLRSNLMGMTTLKIFQVQSGHYNKKYHLSKIWWKTIKLQECSSKSNQRIQKIWTTNHLINNYPNHPNKPKNFELLVQMYSENSNIKTPFEVQPTTMRLNSVQ